MAAIIGTIIFYGRILPFMISEDDSMLVVGGMFLGGFATLYILPKVYKYFKGEFSEK